jgi:hypothetical protein
MLRRARAPRAPPGPRHFILQLSASRTIVIALLAAVCGIEGGPTAAQLAAVESGDDIPSADSSKSTVVLHAATALETDADLSEPLWIVDMMSRSILKVGGAGQIARLGSHIIDPAMLSAMPSTVAPVWLYEAAPARTRWGELAGHHNNIDRRVHREGCKGQHTGWCTVPHDLVAQLRDGAAPSCGKTGKWAKLFVLEELRIGLRRVHVVACLWGVPQTIVKHATPHPCEQASRVCHTRRRCTDGSARSWRRVTATTSRT